MTKQISVTKIFKFEMAHQLDSCYSKGCLQIHGHSYRLEVTFTGPLNEDGMVMDFKMLKEVVQPIVDRLDHSFLNTENYGCNPTAENMSRNIFNEIREKSTFIKCVRLWETDTCFVDYGY